MSEPIQEGNQAAVAVVIPVYRQAHFLLDAVTSVLSQSMADRTRTVIINDGCPWPETDRLCRLLARANPGRIVYLKQKNAGLSEARNRAIRLALQLWPSVRAVFPLDADNALSPTTLERLLERLDTSGADWVYTDQEAIGARGGTIRHPQRFSLFRLLVSNYCDSGSLLHRRLFDSGFWFESSNPEFPEDWDFFARAGLAGFRGAHLADAGFLYRITGGTMHTTQSGPHLLSAPFWPPSCGPRDPQRLLQLEHAEMPRFAFVDTVGGDVSFGSHPSLPPATRHSLADFLALISAQAPVRDLEAPYVPPYAVVASQALLDRLVDARLWDGIAFHAQRCLVDRPVLHVDIMSGAPGWRVDGGSRAALSFARTGAVLHVATVGARWPLASVAGPLSETAVGHAAAVDAICRATSQLPAEPSPAAIIGNDRAFADTIYGRGHRRFMLTASAAPTGVVMTADRLAAGGIPWTLLARGGPLHLVVIGDELPVGPLDEHIQSTAVVEPDERLRVELAGALHPCRRAWFVDTVLSAAELSHAAWLGVQPGFVTTAPDVLFHDRRLGIARQAAMDPGGVFERYVALNSSVGELLSTWGVAESKLEIAELSNTWEDPAA